MLPAISFREVMELDRHWRIVTFGDLNELLPSNTTAPNDIELFEALVVAGIRVAET